MQGSAVRPSVGYRYGCITIRGGNVCDRSAMNAKRGQTLDRTATQWRGNVAPTNGRDAVTEGCQVIGSWCVRTLLAEGLRDAFVGFAEGNPFSD